MPSSNAGKGWMLLDDYHYDKDEYLPPFLCSEILFRFHLYDITAQLHTLSADGFRDITSRILAVIAAAQ